MTDVPKTVSAYMAEIGRKGGKKGKGVAKRRGGASYYKRIGDVARKKKGKK
jgi:hypothetical protein